MRPLYHLVALDVLLTDVEQTNAWRRHAIHVTRNDRPHGGELPQLLRRCLGVGAEVEHVRQAMRGGNRGYDGGALHARECLEHEMSNGRECAGIAGAHACAGMPEVY